MPQHWNYGRPSGRSKHGARNEKKLDLDLHANRPNASRPALVTSHETFPVTLGSNRSNALPAAALQQSVLQHREIQERAEAEVQEVARDLGSGRGHPGRDRPHSPGSPETGPHSIPIRHTRSCESAQQAEVAEGRRSRPVTARKDEAATSETEV